MYGRGSRVRRSVVCTRDRVAGGGYACGARPELHTVCRSFPKISSALSTKVCGGSRSAKKPRLPFNLSPFRWRETGALGMYGRGSRGPTRHVCSICSVVRTRDRVAGAGYACNARPEDLYTVCPHFLKSHQLLVQKFAADRDRQKSSFNRAGRREGRVWTLNRHKREDFAAMHRRPHRPMMC